MVSARRLHDVSAWLDDVAATVTSEQLHVVRGVDGEGVVTHFNEMFGRSTGPTSDETCSSITSGPGIG